MMILEIKNMKILRLKVILNFLFKKILLISGTSLLIWFTIHITLLIIDRLNDEIETVDAAVVLGNKVEKDGQPSKRLEARLNKSVELYEEGYFTFIIVSGGIGKEGYNEPAVMKSYLIDKGIPKDKIIDSNGYNSYMTAENTKEIMHELDLNSVMVITQYFHVSRTKLAF